MMVGLPSAEREPCGVEDTVAALVKSLNAVGTGNPFELLDLTASFDGSELLCIGNCLEHIAGRPSSSIFCIDTATCKSSRIRDASRKIRLPKFSPDGRLIAYLCERGEAGLQLDILDRATRKVQQLPDLPGWVECYDWSPNGDSLLLKVAAHGADLAGAEGAVSTSRPQHERLSSSPIVERANELEPERTLWIYDRSNSTLSSCRLGWTIWEASWCGPSQIAVIASERPGESGWYEAFIGLVFTNGEPAVKIYHPNHQIGGLASSPSGRDLCFVEAVCSDRGLVCGELKCLHIASLESHSIELGDVDCTHVEWRSDHAILIAGHRGLETLVGTLQVRDFQFRELWSSMLMSCSGRFAKVTGLNPEGAFALIGEGFFTAPEIAIVRDGTYRAVFSLELPAYPKRLRQSIEAISWRSEDGTEIQGWYLPPDSPGPHPTVMNIHGGPVWHWKSSWLGHPRSVCLWEMIEKGIAIFLPNPRGSSGRGQGFSRSVVGDLNGTDAADLLSGIEYLVDGGWADRTRLGVMGTSYGGNMTCWLMSQTAVFAAGAAIAPHTNFVSQRLLSNIPRFVDIFLGDPRADDARKYVQRSPVTFAHRVTKPILLVAGALDKCTPAEEAKQFHQAVCIAGGTSELVIYPDEGHGVADPSAVVDFSSRVVRWFAGNLCVETSPATADVMPDGGERRCSQARFG